MGLLSAIREDWGTFLRTDIASGARAFFSPDAPAVSIPVITEKLGTIEQRISDGLTATGLSVLIATVVASGARNQIPGKIAFEKVVAVARVFENPATNLTGITASDCAEKIFWVTRHFKTADGTPLQFEKIQLGTVDPKRICYDVFYNIDCSSSVQPVRT